MSDSQESGQGQDHGGSGATGDRAQPSRWEWLTAAVSTILVLGVIGFMGYQALSTPDVPPLIAIEMDSVMVGGQGYLVEFRARNSGQRTAASLLVEGELRADTGLVEKSEATIDYVPAQGHRRGGLYFSNDPRRYRLEIRPKGYDRP